MRLFFFFSLLVVLTPETLHAQPPNNWCPSSDYKFVWARGSLQRHHLNRSEDVWYGGDETISVATPNLKVKRIIHRCNVQHKTYKYWMTCSEFDKSNLFYREDSTAKTGQDKWHGQGSSSQKHRMTYYRQCSLKGINQGKMYYAFAAAHTGYVGGADRKLYCSFFAPSIKDAPSFYDTLNVTLEVCYIPE